jgi:hypothetical protein
VLIDVVAGLQGCRVAGGRHKAVRKIFINSLNNIVGLIYPYQSLKSRLFGS